MQRAKRGEEQLDDELWSPEHDWILQFDKLLGGKGNNGSNGSKGNQRSSAAGAAAAETGQRSRQ